MEAYLLAFINYEQNDWAKLLPMAEFTYNNVKNNTSYTFFELNYDFHPRVSYKKDVDSRSRLKTSDQLATKLQTLISMWRQNLQHAQELWKRCYDKYANPKSCTPEDKV